ncbi:TerD family protein [Mesorhizobium sp. M0808]|uniref:TerD family protein n=1 Tax=Mesorhizobium sp. M0808 TaxID=2957002 RepID=UPI00333D4FFF
MAISLSKGQTVDLSKKAPGLSHLHVGLGWDPIKKKGFFGFGKGSDSIDLDASILVFDGSKNVIDTVWFQQKKSKDGSILHSGDNLTGEGDGDDEVIRVDLNKLTPAAQHLVVTVNSFRGQTFEEVDNAFCRLVDESSDAELFRYELNEKGRHTGVIMALISRQGGAWSAKAIGEPGRGKTVADMVTSAQSLI